MSDEMSDIHAVRKGLISVSPLQTDTTHHAVVPAFRAWEPLLAGEVAATNPTKPPVPPFTEDSGRQKVRMAEDAWNTRSALCL